MKLRRMLSLLVTCVKLFMQGRFKIYSSQGLTESLSERYLRRLPPLTKGDIGVYINGTHLIFHEEGGLSISNKFNIISSELFILDHRDGYCDSTSAIEPYTECDKSLQPKVIVENFFTLSR